MCDHVRLTFLLLPMGGSRGGTCGLDLPFGKSPVAIGFLEVLVQTPLEKQLDPSGPIASRGRSARPSAKYVDD